MSLCKYCGSDTADESEICGACRRIIDQIKRDTLPVKINGFDYNDVKKNKNIACLAYLPFLFLLPVFFSTKSKYALYHAGYGFRLTLIGISIKIFDIIIKIISDTFFKTIYNEGTVFEYSAVSEIAAIVSLAFGIVTTVTYCILIIIGVYHAYNCLPVNLLFAKRNKNQ